MWDLNNKEHINDIKKRIKRSAIRYGVDFQEIDDCVQYTLEKYLEGKCKNKSIDFSVIDFLRHQFGDTRQPGFEARNNMQKNAKPLSENYILKQKKNNLLRLCKKYLKLIPDKTDKAIFSLRFIWGFTNRDIANLFDITDVAINCRFKRINRQIKEQFAPKA